MAHLDYTEIQYGISARDKGLSRNYLAAIRPIDHEFYLGRPSAGEAEGACRNPRVINKHYFQSLLGTFSTIRISSQ